MRMQFNMELDNSELIINAAHSQVQKALKTVGMKAEKNAKKICPVDTGNLRNSITHQNDKDTVYIGTNVEYAPYVELGTSKMRARPFLKPAVENYGEQYKDLLKQAMSE